jgi:nitrite reductase/ring-hydroxylating ferredoxin subunit/Fe-S cluster biogenesis protein NfuA
VEFDEAVAALDSLVQQLEREGDARALMLLELVDSIHRPGLALIAAGDRGHPIARALLAMYDLAPPDEHTRAEEALDPLREELEAHGGHAVVIGIEGEAVRLRVGGACRTGAAAAPALRARIEAALHRGGFSDVAIEDADEGIPLPLAGSAKPAGVAPSPEPGGDGGPVPLPVASAIGAREPVFVDVGAADEIADGEMRTVQAGDLSVLLVSHGGEVYGFRNACAVDGMPLEGGRLAGAVLVCPWHNCAYDARSGKRVDDSDEAGLRVVPVAQRDGTLRVAVGVE